MKSIKIMRIVLSVIFLLASCAYIVTLDQATHVGSIAYKVQIIPSLLASTIGISIFWLIITLFLGRIYCSTVCPIGTLQDIFIRFLRPFLKQKTFSFSKAHRYRYDIFLIYIACLFCSIAIIPLLLEPWNILENIVTLYSPEEETIRWMHFFSNSLIGVAIGVISFIAIAVMSTLKGRYFCKEICPIGTALTFVGRYAIYHIEIDPDKCINCIQCEDVCKSECIKVVSRYVDDKECVRCFNCLTVCENDAIHLQKNRNRAATPLIRKVNHSVK